MTPVLVSVSDFRSGIADYLQLATQGTTVVVSDKKRRVRLAKLTGERQFDSSAYRAMLSRVARTFAAARHPQWSTSAKLDNWLRTGRLADDRKFHDYS